MKNKWILPIVVLALAAACGRDSVTRVGQKDYEVVEEGSASGVTSTIQGPGETLPPVTGTNADTTTAFGIDPNVASTPGGTLSGTPYPAPAYTAPAPAPAYIPPAPRQEAPPRAEPEPPTPTMTDTATAPEPAPAPEQEPKKEDEEPPPPTTTDTQGQ